MVRALVRSALLCSDRNGLCGGSWGAGANALWECWAASYLRLVQGNATALTAMFDHVWQQIEVNGGADTSSCDGHVGGEHAHLLRLLSLGCVLTLTAVLQ